MTATKDRDRAAGRPLAREVAMSSPPSRSGPLRPRLRAGTHRFVRPGGSGALRPRTVLRPGRAGGFGRTVSRGTGMLPATVVPWPGVLRSVNVAPDRVDPVGHALQAGAPRRGRRVEPDAVVPDLEREPSAVLSKSSTSTLEAPRVLRDVLERLEDAEVDARLDVLRVAPDAVGGDVDRDGGLARLRLERRGEPLVGEQRRVDPAREVAERLERVVGLRLQLRDQLVGLGRVAIERALRRAGASPPARRAVAGRRRGCCVRAGGVPRRRRRRCAVGTSRSSSIRRTLRSTSPACDGEIADQPLLGRRHRVVRRHRDRDRAEQLALVAHLERSVPRHGEGRQRDRLPRRSARRAGHVAADRSSPPTSSQIVTVSAPVPAPRIDAIRGRTSSVEYVSAIRSENSVRTS